MRVSSARVSKRTHTGGDGSLASRVASVTTDSGS